MNNYSSKIITKYAKPVPRYTSYPTAPHFSDQIGGDQYRTWLDNIGPGEPVSIYIHIPFCDRLCWFCGCHTKQTLKYSPVRKYLEVLYKEIQMVGAIVAKRAVVSQLHLGGGSPSLLKAEDLEKLKKCLFENFAFHKDAEISLELDPSDLDAQNLLGFSEFGMTRASIGVQDFAENVQQAINRPQTFDETKFVVKGLRKFGIHSLNIDALYGLPLQTQDSLQETLEQVLSLQPDRIAMFGYAHVPWMKKHQQMIPETSIPGLDERFAQSQLAEKLLIAGGYDKIGLDHFAKPDDTLAIAAMEKRLRRNFQGYTTDSSRYLLGLGASSIGQTPHGFIQNTHATANYMRQVNDGELPIVRGLAISENDKMYGAVIEQLMCYFEIRKDWLSDNFGKSADPVSQLAHELVAQNEEGYFVETDNGFEITEEGKPFTRQFAAQFDEYLRDGVAKHSVAI